MASYLSPPAGAGWKYINLALFFPRPLPPYEAALAAARENIVATAPQSLCGIADCPIPAAAADAGAPERRLRHSGCAQTGTDTPHSASQDCLRDADSRH